MVCRYSVESTLEINNKGVSRKRIKQGYADSNHTSDNDCLEPTTNKRLKRAKTQLLEELSSVPSGTNDSSKKAYGATDSTPVIAQINMKKGEPRSALFELCKKLLWPMPSFTATEHKSKTPMVIGQGEERKKGFISFVSRITLKAPNLGGIECVGDSRADKKSSWDSVAFNMLHKLEQQGKLIICKS